MIFEMRMRSSTKNQVRRARRRGFRFSRVPFCTASASPFCLSSGLQMGQAQEVERGGPQVSHLLNLPAAYVPHLAQAASLFHPAEHLLDLLARSLAQRV